MWLWKGGSPRGSWEREIAGEFGKANTERVEVGSATAELELQGCSAEGEHKHRSGALGLRISWLKSQARESEIREKARSRWMDVVLLPWAIFLAAVLWTCLISSIPPWSSRCSRVVECCWLLTCCAVHIIPKKVPGDFLSMLSCSLS